MTNKAPTTNTLSYFDVFSNEWVTVITIRHPVQQPLKLTDPAANPSFPPNNKTSLNPLPTEGTPDLTDFTTFANLTKAINDSQWNK